MKVDKYVEVNKGRKEEFLPFDFTELKDQEILKKVKNAIDNYRTKDHMKVIRSTAKYMLS